MSSNFLRPPNVAYLIYIYIAEFQFHSFNGSGSKFEDNSTELFNRVTVK